MFQKFKQRMQQKAQAKEEAEKKAQLEAWSKTVPSILGLRINGAVELDMMKFKAFEEYLGWSNIAHIQTIEAVGVVRMADTQVLRFYTQDEGFFQVVVDGELKEENVTDVKLFFFHDTRGVAVPAEWDKLLAPGGEKSISQAQYSVDDQEYRPVWADAGEKSPPVAMTERTYREGSVDETDQFAMLYEREITNGEYQFLLVAGEETIIDNRADRCMVISKGVNLGPSDFDFIA